MGKNSSRVAFWEPAGSPREILGQGGDAPGEGRAQGRAGAERQRQGSVQPWDGQQKRGSKNAFQDKNKPDVHRRNWPVASLGETSVLHLPSPLGAAELGVGAPPRCTRDAEEKRRGGRWSKPVGTW